MTIDDLIAMLEGMKHTVMGVDGGTPLKFTDGSYQADVNEVEIRASAVMRYGSLETTAVVVLVGSQE